jgi:uncharacterized protein (DUF736 family)
MTMIGSFKLDPDGTYSGTVTTLALKVRARIVPNLDKSEDRHPDYRVFAQGRVEIGAAWKKLSDQNKPYLSVSLDDPSFAQPLNAALVGSPDDQEDTFSLVWSRPRANGG